MVSLSYICSFTILFNHLPIFEGTENEIYENYDFDYDDGYGKAF